MRRTLVLLAILAGCSSTEGTSPTTTTPAPTVTTPAGWPTEVPFLTMAEGQDIQLADTAANGDGTVTFQLTTRGEPKPLLQAAQQWAESQQFVGCNLAAATPAGEECQGTIRGETLKVKAFAASDTERAHVDITLRATLTVPSIP